jgi:multiple sugar transport system ATP-binding protein
MTLGQRVAVLDRGRLQQIDTPQRLYQRPANVFVADFIGTPGMNFFATRLLYDAHNELCIDFNGEAVPIPPALKQSLAAVREQEHTLEGVIGGLRPEAFSMSQHGAHQRSLAVTVASVEPLGHETLLYFNSPLQTLAAAALPVAEGANSDAGQIPMAARLAGNLNFCGNAGTVLFADVSKLLLFNRRGKRL